MDAAFWSVIEVYEARARAEAQLPEGQTPRDQLLLPVGRETATLMSLIIKGSGARRILEVGSSFGYSTLWLADAARANGGKVISLELQRVKTEYAGAQLQRAGLEAFVEFRVGNALESLAELAGPFDFALIDLWKDLYVPVWERLQGKLAEGAVVIADNMRHPASARAHAQAYRERVRATPEVSSVLLAVGNGLEVSRYR